MRISIEGNIGAGKSTVLEYLSEHGYEVIPEPVDEWAEWLCEFYNDKHRWAFAFQMKVLLSFLTRGPSDDRHAVFERSPMSTRFVFGQLLFNEGCLTEKEWELYKGVCESYAWNPDVIIYIRVDPEVSLERITTRNRKGENKIDLDYIKRLNFQYNIMLKYHQQKIFEVDGNQDSETVAKTVLDIMRTLC